ncbi:transketolase-like TK C-terminal-containing protein, partial [Salmonella sp. 5694]
MPCFELFEKQDKAYKDRLLQGEVIGVEAAHSNELYKFCDRVYGIESFGESGKDKDVFEHFGFSVPQILNFILDK